MKEKHPAEECVLGSIERQVDKEAKTAASMIAAGGGGGLQSFYVSANDIALAKTARFYVYGKGHISKETLLRGLHARAPSRSGSSAVPNDTCHHDGKYGGGGF